ncbi:hypothetical protein [Methylobacterium nigriterrae]|uniref:hypothetical protein n=1 Tax=Methylobacterium nigriterrae TaxID=3127512 RepID=UPI0030139BD3
MDAKLADHVRAAAADARRRAMAYPGSASADELPWAVIAAFDAEVRGYVERDRRIEDERDRVLIAAVKLAEAPPAPEGEDANPARGHLIDAIDYLEQAVLRFGIVNWEAAKRGFGRHGQRVAAKA